MAVIPESLSCLFVENSNFAVAKYSLYAPNSTPIPACAMSLFIMLTPPSSPIPIFIYAVISCDDVD